MLKIRNGTFETNSSSVHSIVISTSPGTPDYGNYYSEGGEFGWEHFFLRTTQEKLDYIWQGIWECVEGPWKCIPGTIDEWRDIIHEFLPNAELADIPDNDWESGFHYLDHSDELSYLLVHIYNRPETMGRFLVNENSYVETANDNDETAYNFTYPEGDNWEAWRKEN